MRALHAPYLAIFLRLLVCEIAPAVGLAAMAQAATAQHLADHGRTLVGAYDGGQIEIAAILELRADGRFRYVLSYGALDEEAEGRWIRQCNAVLLTSDPVIPPRFVLLEDRGAPDDRLHLKLDLPKGMSGQYFQAGMRLADGTVVAPQLSEEGELPPIGSAVRATSVTLLLPIEGVIGETVPLSDAGGHQLRFRFEPHDLGKVPFAREALRIDGEDLVLRRHDRTIRFRRRSRSPAPS